MKHHIQSFIIISVVILGTFIVVYYLLMVHPSQEPNNSQKISQETTQGATLPKSEDKKTLNPDSTAVAQKENTTRKNIVSPNELLSGGPPKDGIPSIDNPKFISVKEAQDFLKDNEPGISFSMSGIDRFYPYQILVWHELVNDTFKGQRVLISYCPLCGSGIVFDPLVDGERVEFGVSGKLWNSNLVMYDRKTDSYWSQVLGQAIIGPQAGDELEILPYDLTTFGAWKDSFPNGEVLSKKTGAIRFYGTDPYGDYYTNSDIYFPVDHSDSTLDPKEFVLGIIVNGKAKAYLPSAVKEKGKVEDSFQGKTIVAMYNDKLDAVQLFQKKNDILTRINPFSTFWFSWVAVHPDTELYD